MESEKLGEILTDANIESLLRLMHVVDETRLNPFTTKSTVAREFANEVGTLACLGYITTECAEQTFGNKWLATANGLAWHEVMTEFMNDVLTD